MLSLFPSRYIQAIPLSGSFDFRGLSYRVPEGMDDLVIWQPIWVPLKDSEEFAIVSDVSVDVAAQGISEEDIRDVRSIESPFPILAPYQVRLVESLAYESMVHVHKVLQVFLPQPVLKGYQKWGYPQMPTNLTAGPDNGCVRAETKSLPSFAIRQSDRDWREALAEEIARFEASETTVAVVLPDDSYVESLREWKTANGTGYGEWTFAPESLSPKKRHSVALSILSEEVRVIIWSRKLLQYNLGHTSRIVYVEDALRSNYLHSFHSYSFPEWIKTMYAHGGPSYTYFSTVPGISHLFEHMKQQLPVAYW